MVYTVHKCTHNTYTVCIYFWVHDTPAALLSYVYRRGKGPLYIHTVWIYVYFLNPTLVLCPINKSSSAFMQLRHLLNSTNHSPLYPTCTYRSIRYTCIYIYVGVDVPGILKHYYHHQSLKGKFSPMLFLPWRRRHPCSNGLHQCSSVWYIYDIYSIYICIYICTVWYARARALRIEYTYLYHTH